MGMDFMERLAEASRGRVTPGSGATGLGLTVPFVLPLLPPDPLRIRVAEILGTDSSTVLAGVFPDGCAIPKFEWACCVLFVLRASEFLDTFVFVGELARFRGIPATSFDTCGASR